MFANLIESQSHGKEFKRRGRFVLATAAAYTVLFFVAGIVSIYAYDARVEARADDLEIVNWIPPVDRVIADPVHPTQPVRRPNQPNAPVDQHITIPVRTDAFAPATDPTKVPDHVGTQAQPVPPVIGDFRLGTRNLNPPVVATADQGTCVTCSEPARVVVETTPPPAPQPVKPPTQRLTSIVLASKAISLPQPPYPTIAKQARIQGQVNIQILVDERGTVISAQVVSGNPMLTYAARDAAMRARFTPTLLNNQPAKVQGTIVYNFVLQ